MASIVRSGYFAWLMLALGTAASAGEECVTTKTQPNVRRHIEKLAHQTAGDDIDRSTFSYCGFNSDEYASIATIWRPQDDGSRLRLKVNCQRPTATPKKPWACEPAPEREMDVTIPGRAGPLVARVDVKLPVELMTHVALRAFEAAPHIKTVKSCDSPAGSIIYADQLQRAFAAPGNDMFSIYVREDRLMVDRTFTTIVFKRNTAAPDGFELDCWYTYDEL